LDTVKQDESTHVIVVTRSAEMRGPQADSVNVNNDLLRWYFLYIKLIMV